jgi:cellulose synthase/poly-beta-1,6-N-acetylglucosamine synthase-like glycosyltransferase
MADTLTISVIIPTLNEEHFISAVLADLYHQTRQPDQVLVVDGHSTDKTAAVVKVWSKKWPAVTLLASPKTGVGNQRDFGGRAAVQAKSAQKNRQQLLYFFDADVRVPRDFLDKTISEILHHSIDAACPRYIPVTSTLRNFHQKLMVKTLFAFLNCLFWFGQKYFPAGAGPCMIVTAPLFQKLQGFNSKILVDDLDFVHRAGMLGNFAILDQPVFVSTRRFEKYGTLQTFWQYLQVSWLFITHRTEHTNTLRYEFGKFKK